MSLFELKRLADEYSLYYADGVAYGSVKGCFISIIRIPNSNSADWRFCIYIGSPQQENPAALLAKAEAAAAVVRWEATDFIYGISQPLPDRERSNLHIAENGRILQVDMPDHADHGSLRQLRAFIENILPKIAPHTSPDFCAGCGKKIMPADKLSVLTGRKTPDSPEPVFLPDGAVVPMHVSCAQPFAETSRKAVRQNQERHKRNLFAGILTAVIFLFVIIRRLIS